MTGKVNVAEHTSTGWGSKLLTPGHYTETLPKSMGYQEQSPLTCSLSHWSTQSSSLFNKYQEATYSTEVD